MGTWGRRFSHAFFIKSAVFQRNGLIWSYIENGFARLSNHDRDNEGNEKIQNQN